MRLLHLEDRISTLRRYLSEEPPRFVVFYGLPNDPVDEVPYPQHRRVSAEHDLVVGEPMKIVRTVFVVEKHLTAYGTTTEHWIDLGRRIRDSARPEIGLRERLESR